MWKYTVNRNIHAALAQNANIERPKTTCNNKIIGHENVTTYLYAVSAVPLPINETYEWIKTHEKTYYTWADNGSFSEKACII